MKPRLRLFITTALLLVVFNTKAVNVTIIESLTGNWWAVQDSIWKDVAVSMGYNAIIVPQNTLDNISNLNTTDILIVSSGTILQTGTNRINTICQYVLSGRSAYVQSEYQGYYGGTITFDSVMQAVGANFNWIATVSGQLIPMNVLGTLGTMPNSVPVLNFFNYGYSGTGTGVEKFLEFQGNHFGFCYTDTACEKGTVITTSDEDWVWHNQSPLLMQNILYRLANNCATSIEENTANKWLLNVYPNPVSDYVKVDFLNDGGDLIKVNLMDASGRIIKEYNTYNVTLLIETPDVEKGIYLLCVVNTATGVKHASKLIKN